MIYNLGWMYVTRKTEYTTRRNTKVTDKREDEDEGDGDSQDFA